MKNAPPVIAIDGPSASGKGTVAETLARRLGFHYLESGALYRLVALAAQRRGIQLDAASENALAQLARSLDAGFRDGNVFMQKHNVTIDLRNEECGRRASIVAAFQKVRSALLERQRGYRVLPGLVADGRDMGTVVFPDAELKVFLTADVAERARRRYKQLIDKGISANLPSLLRDLEERDRRDRARSVAPLTAAPDALEVDSSRLDIEQVVDLVLGEWRKRVGSGAPS